MSHTVFVTAAYAISALVIVALIGWIVIDRRLRSRELAELERRGVRRRSSASEPQ